LGEILLLRLLLLPLLRLGLWCLLENTAAAAAVAAGADLAAVKLLQLGSSRKSSPPEKLSGLGGTIKQVRIIFVEVRATKA
jgi:hypothetical protein